ncbi:MAG TPA: SH3 domain-containing protein [Spirochaetota bacterium]|nr:SH3 domain-containing protein [Spirochaetota bacterium]HOS32979.1 SH3 domain-containing protein [Spirochaetota bacterium]HOS55034.1 SH3 domain-containing protein [Spirochaetota bacterium]HQF77726.1 SH3 domain-containing protein [Spirochaetota bacterium]HQH30879.1 SH3 domain-containing protein [Spirochaetota bacterium]
MSRKEILFIIIFIISSFQNLYGYDWMTHYKENILITGDGLRIREEPSIEGKVLGRLRRGDVVMGEWDEKKNIMISGPTTVNGVKNYWIYIRTKEGLTGWVFMEYIACPFIKYDDRVVYVEYKEREFIWQYNTIVYKEAMERDAKLAKSIFHFNIITPILVVKYPDKRVELELSYFNRASNNDFIEFSPYKMREIKIWDNVNTLMIKSEIFSQRFEQGGVGPFRHNYLFKYDRDRIDRIFEYEDVGQYPYDSFENCIEFIKENNKVDKIKKYREYIPRNIAGPDYVNKILPTLDESKKKLLNKYYYCLEPVINNGYLKENYLKSDYFPNFNIEKEKEVFYKYFKSTEEHGYFYINISSKEDIKTINEFFKRNKLIETNYFTKYDYIPDYCLYPNLSFEQLKDAREILVGSGYIKNYEDEIKTYVWNEKEFIEEKK